MSIEHIEVNGHELTAFDLPPEPSETYSVWVDGLGEVVVEKGKPPEKSDVPAKYMRKLVPALCEQNAELEAQNAKLRELVLHMYTCMGNVDADGNHECFSCEYEDTECDFAGRMAQLGIGVGE